MIQPHSSWAEAQSQTEEQAMEERPNGGMPFPKADMRDPEDFEAVAKRFSIENVEDRVLTSADLEAHLDRVQHCVALGLEEVYAHDVGGNQEEFIGAHGERMIHKFDWPEKG